MAFQGNLGEVITSDFSELSDIRIQEIVTNGICISQSVIECVREQENLACVFQWTTSDMVIALA